MTRNWWVGVAAGLVVGLGAVVGVKAATDEASAQAGFSVSAAQLQTNQRISQAAVRRSNRSLNYLAPVRTATTDDADDGTEGVRPLADIPGAGEGWTSERIADGAITESKVSDGAVTGSKIGDEAITESKLSPGVRQGLAGFASVDLNGNFTANSGAFTAVARPGTGRYVLDTAEPVGPLQRCAANVTPIDNTLNNAYVGKYAVTGDNEITVRIYFEDGGGSFIPNDEPFSISLFCIG